MIATLAAYIYIGNSKIANIAEINARLKSLDEEILREEISRPTNAAVLPYCEDLAELGDESRHLQLVKRFRTVNQSHLCTQFNDLQKKLELAYGSCRDYPRGRPRAARAAQRRERLRAAGPDGPARFNDLRSAALSAQCQQSSPLTRATCANTSYASCSAPSSEWRSACSRAPAATLPLPFPSARSGHRRLHSSPATASNPCSAC